MDRTQFFFCYNKELFTFLHDVKCIDYITIAKNQNTDKTFSMFYKNDDLQKALDEYKQLH
ncbi:hypothetical protein [Rummeliibacillus sp. POC4]|uniref:hypothetical protein n=1 Tax=Rummeliibacillus sp. POC4 TaxID=2305899 RepID=UPI000E66B822|nr:hypothetical protein [Rummeliibacillus sp. POC4]RIJ65312.1 hypothetical protein D1606_08295 [Rummeliibacillus sp. POC4]